MTQSDSSLNRGESTEAGRQPIVAPGPGFAQPTAQCCRDLQTYQQHTKIINILAPGQIVIRVKVVVWISPNAVMNESLMRELLEETMTRKFYMQIGEFSKYLLRKVVGINCDNSDVSHNQHLLGRSVCTSVLYTELSRAHCTNSATIFNNSQLFPS